MMKTMLTGANLLSGYWLHAIRHAVYVKNRLPHQTLPGHITPFERYTIRRPDFSHLRVVGSHVTVKQPRVRNGKLDPNHTTTCIFLGFTATDRTIWFEDAAIGELKSAHHAVFDEAHYSANNRPPYARELMNLVEEHLASPTIPPKSIPDPEHTTNLPTHIIPNLADDDSSLVPTTPIPHLVPLTLTVHTPALNRYPLRPRIPVNITRENTVPIPTVVNLPHIIPPNEEDDNPSLIC